MNGDALSVSQLLGDSVSPQLNVRGNASQKLFEFRRIQGFGSLLCVRLTAIDGIFFGNYVLCVFCVADQS
jgi:hypothetical protein